jgi:hypothetical protein
MEILRNLLPVGLEGEFNESNVGHGLPSEVEEQGG